MVIANLQSKGQVSNGPTMSNASFCQGPSGKGTGIIGAGEVLVVLSFSWQDTQVAMTDCTSASVLGHQYKSLSLCFVQTMPYGGSHALGVPCGNVALLAPLFGDSLSE